MFRLNTCDFKHIKETHNQKCFFGAIVHIKIKKEKQNYTRLLKVCNSEVKISHTQGKILWSI